MFKSTLFKNQDKCDDFILTFKPNPFPAPPASTDYLENPAKFIIGREKELELIGSAIRESLDTRESKLMLLQGKQGIGKSTIISSIPKYLEQQDLLDKVLIVYFNTSPDQNDFRVLNFYSQIISVLDQTGFLEKLVYATLQKIIFLANSEGGKLKEELETLPLSPEYLKKIENDTRFLKDVLFSKIPILQNEIRSFIKTNYRLLRNYLQISNFSFLFTLLDCFLGRENFQATKAISGKGTHYGFSITTDNEALSAFNDLKKLTRWVYGEATFLIIFDHLERGLSNATNVFQALFSLLLGLRQQPYTCILISGTLDAFRGFYDVLQEDMRQQVDNWFSFYETLRPLTIKSVVDIIKRHLDMFWRNSNFQPTLEYSLYPFGKESVTHLFDVTNEDIRKTLVDLHEMIKTFRNNQKVEPVITFFEALAKLRQDKNLILKSREVNVLADKLLDPHIQDKSRSTSAELAIYDLFNILKKTETNITDVKHEPPIGRRKLRPDIYFELFGGLTLKELKRVGIEVKIFRKTKEVSKKEVRKTHSLIEDGELDFVLWITTAALSSVKHELSTKYKSRVGRTIPLTKEEQAYLALTIHFKEIFSRKPDPQEAKFLLNQIGIQIDELMESLKQDVIKPSPKIRITQEPVKVIKQPVQTDKIPQTMIKPKPVQTSLPISSPKKPEILSQAKEINSVISEIITEQSTSGKKYTAKSTIIKQSCKQVKIKTLSKEDEEQMDTLVTEIAKKKGLHVTPMRIYFS